MLQLGKCKYIELLAFIFPTQAIYWEEALAGPGLQGTERAVSSGKRKSNRWAQRDHWFGRVSAGIRLEFRWKS